MSVKPYCRGVRIYDWAYNAKEGAPILAGQIGETVQEGKKEVIFVDESKDDFIYANGLKVYSFGKMIMIQDNYRNYLLSITIFNHFGQLVKEIKTSNVSTAIDLINVPAGMYSVDVNGNKTSFSKQLGIQ